MTLSSNDSVAKYIADSGQAAWNVPNLSAQTPLRAIKKVGIIGAGTMGGGISMNFANAGIPVTIVEMKQIQDKYCLAYQLPSCTCFVISSRSCLCSVPGRTKNSSSSAFLYTH